MNEWAQPLGLLLIAVAIGAYLVQRRLRDKPGQRKWWQLAVALEAGLLVFCIASVFSSVFAGVPD